MHRIKAYYYLVRSLISLYFPHSFATSRTPWYAVTNPKLKNISNNDIELITIVAKVGHHKKVKICAVYRPPGGSYDHAITHLQLISWRSHLGQMPSDWDKLLSPLLLARVSFELATWLSPSVCNLDVCLHTYLVEFLQSMVWLEETLS